MARTNTTSYEQARAWTPYSVALDAMTYLAATARMSSMAVVETTGCYPIATPTIGVDKTKSTAAPVRITSSDSGES
jgi:hypothetical protein